MMPLEGNILAAQDQFSLYTYPKWRGEQRGVGYLVYQMQISSPPILQELKVEEHFQELPCWEVTHFVWMIAWGWRIHMEMLIPNIFQIPCLKGVSRHHLIAFLSTLLIHDDSYLANFHAWERQYGDSLLTQHLIIWGRSSYVDATLGGDILQFYSCNCLRTSNICEGGL